MAVRFGIAGGKLLVIDHSQVTTSVSGLSGNGGDIRISADALVMHTGFIQANTSGAGASGGNVFIDVQTLIPSGGTLLIAGTTPAVFQSAAFRLERHSSRGADRRQRHDRHHRPALDIGGTLRGLSTEVISSAALGKDLCRLGASSSLTPLGRGGLRATASGMIRPEIEMTSARSETSAHENIAKVTGNVATGRCDY